MGSVARPKRGTYLMILALVTAASACSSAPSLPEAYLGRWYYQGSSGGMSGGGAGDPATGYIVITMRNTIERYEEDGTRTATDVFEPHHGETIFSTQNQWLVRVENAMEQVIRLHEEGTMSLSDNVYDGFQLGYARSR